jgi:hypothetical protein
MFPSTQAGSQYLSPHSTDCTAHVANNTLHLLQTALSKVSCDEQQPGPCLTHSWKCSHTCQQTKYASVPVLHGTMAQTVSTRSPTLFSCRCSNIVPSQPGATQHLQFSAYTNILTGMY